MSYDVKICPGCNSWFINRKYQKCTKCGVYIIYSGEYFNEDMDGYVESEYGMVSIKEFFIRWRDDVK